MAVIGVYDFDFMNHRNAFPNLECAKLCTFHQTHQRITTLAPILDPTKYTKFLLRKDFDDGNFPSQLFQHNVSYGGRAFNPKQYIPLSPQIENTVPNMYIYEKYAQYFGSTKKSQQIIHTLIKCAHLRLAPYGVDQPINIQRIKNILGEQNYLGLILHDYDLASIPKIYDIIFELSNSRHFKTKEGIKPFSIGNKFPIRVSTPEELEGWLKIPTREDFFFFEYQGLMPDDLLHELCEKNERLARKLSYNITGKDFDENYFILYDLPKLYLQVLYLRRRNLKILLKYDETKILSPELRKLIELLNCWFSMSWREDIFPYRQRLFDFCSGIDKMKYYTWAYRVVTVTQDEARDIFQYIREKNYSLFQMFYSKDAIIFKGGNFVDEWTENKGTN